jgi:hypothetical protein
MVEILRRGFAVGDVASTGEIKVKEHKRLPGGSRSRRPKTGKNRRMLILLKEAEKMRIEKAAAKKGVSLSRFIVERALRRAERVLSRSA